MGLSNAIMSMASDAKSQTLAVATGNGAILFVKPQDDAEWTTVFDLGKSLAVRDVPALSVSHLQRSQGQSLFVVGFASGMVKIYLADSGAPVCELAAHTRQVSAVACHQGGKSVFATVSDDTFMNVWEVSGNKLETIDVQLVVSSRCADLQVTGVAFGGPKMSAVVASIYDYKQILVWDDLI